MSAQEMAAPAPDPRTDPPPCGSERETLLGFLDYQRRTLELKCTGLGAAELGTRAVPPSGLSLLGLVRHLSDVERFWVRACLAGDPAPPLYWGPDGNDTDFDFPAADARMVALSLAAWKDEMAFADAALGSEPLKRAVEAGHHGTVTVRWILVHLIEEYSRHNGHADLLRECLDGTVGE
ncbi:DinB family protein [Paeniglutamicibacter psychrophenolicus]|uniref:DinB family protein n=1 Tax=Paeniglutamicibacter psychrophenolicus TaxID=257454 RepID=UPI00277D629A|nr:DinB family protein [Paeniglutamicibacter psychrophenolicus]MDQ0092685.1 putative damage-inducible protein DinB [Paeniglutamicibacter psychrophenolicus]